MEAATKTGVRGGVYAVFSFTLDAPPPPQSVFGADTQNGCFPVSQIHFVASPRLALILSRHKTSASFSSAFDFMRIFCAS